MTDPARFPPRTKMRRTSALIAALSLLCGGTLYAQSTISESTSARVSPESGFLSSAKYTNAFFGFSLALPQETVLNEQTLSLSRGSHEHLLLSFHSTNGQLVSFTITATEISGATDKDSRKTAESMDHSKPKKLLIGGKSFWTSGTVQTHHRAQMGTVVYTTSLEGYVLEFKIFSLDADTLAQLKQKVEQVAFFDPSTSRTEAGADSRPYTPGFSPFVVSLIGRLSAGAVTGNVYSNDQLKFRYEYPAEWTLMSKASGKEFFGSGATFLAGNSPAVQAEHDAANQCAKQLLFVRRFLENPPSGQFNPMVVFVAADPKCVSRFGFPKSVNDGESIQQVARDILLYFKPEDTKLVGPLRVRAFSNAQHVMIDISQSFGLSVPAANAPLNVRSSMLIMQSGEYWVIWEFAASDNAELEELRNTKVFFDDGPAPRSEITNP